MYYNIDIEYNSINFKLKIISKIIWIVFDTFKYLFHNNEYQVTLYELCT